MKKRVLIVLLCFVGALSSAFAAEKKVQGVVISSEDNLPLIGASVYVTAEDLKKAGSAQTTMGVITDVDGQFSIAIPAGITRFFCSYVGYDVLEVKLVPGKEHYEITLHASSQMLDAVVEYPADGKNEKQRDGGRNRRHGDIADLVPTVGAVYFGRLVKFLRDSRDRRHVNYGAPPHAFYKRRGYDDPPKILRVAQNIHFFAH